MSIGDNMSIGERIKNRRLELGLSVDEVAEKIGKNRATVYRYESSEIEDLPTSVLEPLSKVLMTSPAYLMGWDREPDELDNKKSSSENSDELQNDDLIILNRNAKNLTPEQRKQLLDMAKVMFKEDWDD